MVAWETPRSAPVTISLSAPVRRVRRALHRPGVRAAELRGGLESGHVGGEGRCAALQRPAALHAGQARVLQVPAGRAGPSHPRPTPVPPRAVLKTPERATSALSQRGLGNGSPVTRVACGELAPQLCQLGGHSGSLEDTVLGTVVLTARALKCCLVPGRVPPDGPLPRHCAVPLLRGASGVSSDHM